MLYKSDQHVQQNEANQDQLTTNRLNLSKFTIHILLTNYSVFSLK